MRIPVKILLLLLCVSCAPLPSIDLPDSDINNTPPVDAPGKEDEPSVEDFLMAYYTFDNSTADLSRNSYDAVAIGTPTFTEDTPDGSAAALRVNGIKEQYINIPYEFMNGLKNYTVAMWIKDFNSGILFSAISSDYIRSDYPRLVVTDEQKFRFYAGYDNYDSSVPFSYDCMSMMAGDWHHLAVTVDSAASKNGYVKTILYVDGVRVDSMEKYWSEGAAYKMVLGGNNDGKYPLLMSATYDNVRFYNCTLTAGEIKNLYNERL